MFFMLTSFTSMSIIKSMESLTQIFELDFLELLIYTIAILIVLAQLILVFLIDYFLHRSRHKLDTDSFKAMYGTLFQGVNTFGKSKSYFYEGFSFKRRLFLTISIVFITSNASI